MLPRVLACQVIVVAHLVPVEGAVTDVALEVPHEIPLFFQRQHQSLIVDPGVHAAPLQSEHMAPEPVHHVRPGVRLLWLVPEYWDAGQ